jgi:hypothetical protein
MVTLIVGRVSNFRRGFDFRKVQATCQNGSNFSALKCHFFSAFMKYFSAPHIAYFGFCASANPLIFSSWI